MIGAKVHLRHLCRHHQCVPGGSALLLRLVHPGTNWSGVHAAIAVFHSKIGVGDNFVRLGLEVGAIADEDNNLCEGCRY